MFTQEEWYLGRSLSLFHGKRIAIILRIESESRVLCGTGCYEADQSLGNVLRIQVECGLGEEAQHLIVVEDQWRGLIRSGSKENCDVCLIPSPGWRVGAFSRGSSDRTNDLIPSEN